MAKGKKLDFSNLYEYRRSLGVNQSTFWSRFGVTQSGGSRYETGRNIPTATAILVYLCETGQVSDEQLEAARKAVGKR